MCPDSFEGEAVVSCPCFASFCQGRHKLALVLSGRRDPAAQDSNRHTDPPTQPLAAPGPSELLEPPRIGRTPRCVHIAAGHAQTAAAVAGSEAFADGAATDFVVEICAAD